MEISVTLLLTDRPGVLAQATVVLQPLGLKFRRYTRNDKRPRPGFTQVTLIAEGDDTPQNLITKLKDIDGVVEVIEIESGYDTPPQKSSTDIMGPYLDTQSIKDASSAPSLDSYFREQLRGLVQLLVKLQGQDKLQLLLAEINKAAAETGWPTSLKDYSSDNAVQISPIQYHFVFRQACDYAEKLIGRPLVVRQFQTVAKRLGDSGADVAALSQQLGVI